MENIQLVRQVISLCLSSDTIDEWETFLENGSLYLLAEKDNYDSIERPPSSVRSYSLSERELHIEFESMIDSRMRDHCISVGFAKDRDFERILVEMQDDPLVDTFRQVLLLAASFEAFSDVVRSKEKRAYFVHILRQWSRTLTEYDNKK